MSHSEVKALFRALLTGADPSHEITAWQESDSRYLATLSTTVFHDTVARQFASAEDPAIPVFVERTLARRGETEGVSAAVAVATIKAVLGAYQELERVPADQVVPTQVLLTAATLDERKATDADVDALLVAAEPTVAAAMSEAPKEDGER